MKFGPFLAFSLVISICLIPLRVDAQLLKKLGKKAKEGAVRGVENTVERKSEEKAAEKTDQAIEGVFGIPKKIMDKEDNPDEKHPLDGIWYYEKLEGVPGFETLNDCGKKSNITYSGNTYRTQFYDNDCNMLTDSGGTFQLSGKVMTVIGEKQDEVSHTKVTTTQTILEQSESRLVIKDDATGAVVVLIRKME